ncbi:type III secretion system domain-containing protein [Klebsiella michiganensis]|jgi:hypothetical protein|uniref:type III secretion system domain-containing protein n=1 Tax=Klebsiella michiganensis TaxID=1134687 RepID=UPI00256FF763|nr:type III secretion system domain-containing protein [Klebsiella michiganensis]MDL4454945.1 type III secretion system domain-containing protein [Klebsiella michiganensis]
MTLAIDAGVQRLHQLAWQPGAWMHPAWWQHLTLDAWQQSYRDYPACRATIDAVIIQQRAFPSTPLPAELSNDQRQLLNLEPRLPRLCTALGLLALGCPDYLLTGSYRRCLLPILGEQGCDRLLALGKFHVSSPPLLTAEQISEQALERGLRWWRADVSRCPVRQTLTWCLPPGPVESADSFGAAIPWLLRIGRFL